MTLSGNRVPVPDVDTLVRWRKSSYSGYNGNCTEVAVMAGSREGGGYVIAVRDSKNPAGGMLTFSPGDWQEFTSRIKAAA